MLSLFTVLIDLVMADLSGFGSSTFQIESWINTALQERPEEEPLESYLAQLAMKLHIISQDYTDQLETGMVEAMTSIPRVLTEVSRIESTLHGIETEMKSLAAQLKQFDEKNIAGVEDLSRLDTLKGNMETCRAMLAEHTRWNQLVREAKNFLENRGRLTDSADRIEVMVRSLEILQNMPGHEDRMEACASLTEMLLAAVRPRMRSDISGHDLSPLHEYLYVYGKLGRQEELEDEYIQARPERVRGDWRNSQTDAADFSRWFASFLSRFSTLLSEEAENIVQLFGKERAPRLLSSMIETTLAPLAASVAEKIAATRSPIIAVETFNQMNEFAKLSINLLEGCEPFKVTCVLSALFGGFIIYMDSYADAEADYLKSLLSSAIEDVQFEETESLFGSNSASDPIDVCSAFGEKLVSAADAAFLPTQQMVHRSVRFMGGLKVKPSIKSVAAVLTQFVRQLTSKVDDLRIASGHPPDRSTTGIATPNALSSASSSAALSAAGSEESNAHTHAQSWARRLETCDLGGRELVPAALRALQAAGRLSKRLRELDAVSVELFSELTPTLFRDSSSISDRNMRGLSSSSGLSSSQSSSNVCYTFAAQLLHNNPSASSELRSFLSTATSHHATQTAFAAVAPFVSKLKTAAGALLFDLCTCAPEKLMEDLHTEDVWIDQSSRDGDDSLLPQQSFTQVGEHLLSLVNELEAFAGSEALPDLLHLSGEAGVLAVGSRGWRRLRELLDITREDDGVDQLCKRASCSAAIVTAEKAMFGVALSSGVEETIASSSSSSSLEASGSLTPGRNKPWSGIGGGAGVESFMLSGSGLAPEDEEAATLWFVNDWLGAIVDATAGLVLVKLASITALSKTGCAQMRVDVDYLRNVFNAMGLKLHPMLEHLYHLLDRDPSTLAVAVDAAPVRSAVLIALQKFDSKIAAAMVRGVAL